MSREQLKATQYIQQLDNARCQGNWDLIPELVRKVKKHAPQRKCLVATAESEYAVAQFTQATPQASNARSSIATISPQSELSRHIPQLLEAIEGERNHAEDIYQAKACLGWIHWELGETSLASSRLPHGIESEFSQLDGTNHEAADWTQVCAVKASYIRGTVYQRSGATTEALEIFDSTLPIVANRSSAKQGKELRTWTELYLTSYCMTTSKAIQSRMSLILETENLSAFRNWAKFWEQESPTPTGGRVVKSEFSRREVWKEYYAVLSVLLRANSPFPTSSLTTAYAEASTRLQQWSELKRVEARYETLLLNELRFPKADEASEEVEIFVNTAVANWRILCGGQWKDCDLGEGGAEAVSRGVLDILYRAATKSFHSTSILRHLFTVHLAVGDFDLAFKAFDTYMDIVQKAKARVEKTGDLEPSLDDDETILITASECIKALCRFGGSREFEKAKELGQFFETWLDKHHPVGGQGADGKTSGSDAASIAPNVFALAWRSIGIGHARWAQFTHDAISRSEIQLRALKCFRKALLPQFESTADVETLFALGLLLAERRELGPAIELVKAGLLNSSARSSHSSVSSGKSFCKERSLIPLWHLMALLLSARQEFVTAARSCEGAFEQFEDSGILFGDSNSNAFYRSAHLNEGLENPGNAVVDKMDDFEKEHVLEVKMTQLALLEILEGPDVAVNASDELLSLYSRLFGDLKSDFVSQQPAILPPQSSAGTMRSIKGSIFGRSGRSTRKSQTSSGEMVVPIARPQTMQTMKSAKAPTIHITTENGTATKHHYSTREATGQSHEKPQQKPGTLSRKIAATNAEARGPSRDRGLSASGRALPKRTTGDSQTTGQDLEAQNAMDATNGTFRRQTAESLDVAISKYPKSLPPSRFPKRLQIRRRTAILIKVWLLISGFYRRASLYEDAKGAIDEAQTLIRNLELETSKDPNNNIAVGDTGWGCGKSIAELWADIESERGALALAQDGPYAALALFETALTHFADHPSSIVGLSNILLDIYTEDLLPPPSIPNLVLPGTTSTLSSSTVNTSFTPTSIKSQTVPAKDSSSGPRVSSAPLGLSSAQASSGVKHPLQDTSPSSLPSGLQPNYKEASTTLLDRLAARDRAYGLLTALTKLGTGWNYSEAWFALARAYEVGGQLDKAREVLWWCVELEEGRAVRDWSFSGGTYIL